MSSNNDIVKGPPEFSVLSRPSSTWHAHTKNKKNKNIVFYVIGMSRAIWKGDKLKQDGNFKTHSDKYAVHLFYRDETAYLRWLEVEYFICKCGIVALCVFHVFCWVVKRLKSDFLTVVVIHAWNCIFYCEPPWSVNEFVADTIISIAKCQYFNLHVRRAERQLSLHSDNALIWESRAGKQYASVSW